MLVAFWAEDFQLCDVEFAISSPPGILPCNGATVELRRWGDTELWIDALGVVCPCLSIGGEHVAQWGGVTLYVGEFFPWSPSPSSNTKHSARFGNKIYLDVNVPPTVKYFIAVGWGDDITTMGLVFIGE